MAAVILFVVLGLCLLSTLRLSFQEDISDFLPQEQQEKLSGSGGDSRMAVFFSGGSTGDKLDAMYAFADAWNAAHEDLQISPEADNSEVLSVFDFLSANWPYFLEEADYARMDSLLTPESIGQKLAHDKLALLGSSLQARYLRTDPLGLFSPVLQRLNALRPASRMVEGCLFTPDEETGILFFNSPYGGSESGQNAGLVADLSALKAQMHAQFPKVSVTSTGGPEVAAENAGRIKKDSLLALAVAFLLIALILWFSYKRFSDVLWILLSIGAGAVFALGVIALFKSSVSLIVLGIGSTIIGIAVNYPLHYVDHLKYQPDKRQALSEQVNPLLVGNITTVGAFLSLLLLKADALHDFGFIGAMMLVGTIVFVLVFLPVFVPQRRATAGKLIQLDFDRYLHAGPKLRTATFVLFLLATGALLWQSRKVGFDANLHNINHMTREQADGFAVLESLRPKAVVMPGTDRASQEAALERWNAFWAPRQAAVSKELQEQSLRQGFTSTAFQPFLDVLNKDWQVQEPRYFKPVDFSPEASVTQGLVENLSQDFDTIGLVCSLIVFLFLWISFGSLELSLMAFLPLVVSWYWIQGIMGLSGLQFNIVNIILATFIFGQGDDYSIFITEGLLYERATGKKILHSYKNAVVLSALIMFIGIGALILAKHPAMRSLGQVTVIGMITVVAMAYYLPPLVFRWITTRKGEARKQPITLLGGLATLYIGLQMVLWMSLLSVLALFMPRGEAFHRLIRRVASWAIRIVPGCKYSLLNPHGEDFSKPAVYICNHQSHLDVLALIALQPKLIFMTNDWVWNFPFYGAVLRKAGYFPASWGLSKSSAHVRKLLAGGYSLVIFPEGTRSMDGSILRFHRGAFLTARELGLDILPLCLHGFNYALPKHDFLLRKAGLSLEIGKRLRVPEEAELAAFTREMRHFYQEWYGSIRRQRETAAYIAPYVRAQYLYKGHDALLECRRVLTKANFARIDALSGPSLEIRDAGCGVQALLIALTHPDMQVTAHEADEEKNLTAMRCDLPANLSYEND
ncbi:MAG: 1-acyl-sn-glycerol-3-phosphate acyltransferase [Bacteroidales bacterium]|nr:1-acyl-sn-glycerol-3-phosphate acyltransferase [Bacteroidales bacterium]